MPRQRRPRLRRPPPRRSDGRGDAPVGLGAAGPARGAWGGGRAGPAAARPFGLRGARRGREPADARQGGAAGAGARRAGGAGTRRRAAGSGAGTGGGAGGRGGGCGACARARGVFGRVMATTRIHDLAAEFGVSSEQLIGMLKEMDIFVRSHLSPLPPEQGAAALFKALPAAEETRGEPPQAAAAGSAAPAVTRGFIPTPVRPKPVASAVPGGSVPPRPVASAAPGAIPLEERRREKGK